MCLWYTYVYTTGHKFWVFIYLFMSYADQGCIYLIKNIVKTVILWHIIKISNNNFQFQCILKCDLFLCCKAEFSVVITPASVSHDPSEIILVCWFAALLLYTFFLK